MRGGSEVQHRDMSNDIALAAPNAKADKRLMNNKMLCVSHVVQLIYVMKDNQKKKAESEFFLDGR